MKRRLWFSLVGTVLIVIAALAGNLAAGNTPILGLDLQGGVSVILAPAEEASEEELIVVRDLVRTELERSGIAEPDVRVQGANVVVDLPGVKDQQEALEAVAVSGIVELRPVVGFEQCQVASAPDLGLGGDDDAPVDFTPIDELPVDEAPADEAPADEEGAAATSLGSRPLGLRRSAPEPADDSVPADDAPADDTVPADDAPDDDAPSEPADDSIPADTVPVDDAPVDEVPIDAAPDGEPVPQAVDEPVLDTPLLPTPSITGADLVPTIDGSVLCLGPSPEGATGEVFARQGATTSLNNGWGVDVELRPEGQDTWNALATECFNRTPTCPSTDPTGTQEGQLAIVLDGVVQSAPTVNQPVFDDFVSITGSFTEDEARQLTDVINRGAFPVEVVPQEARTVSASAGGDSLRAAIIAGLIGVALVLTFLVFYYRWLALVIIGGLTVWAATVFSVSSFVSGWSNYSLTLAGVTGIIVAVGVTVDSYVVFFERMKDEIRNGRTLRNAAPRSFNSTWRTIWTADLVSVIGAAILFSLSVGSVRGFALYLGITTLCDLFVCFFFTRPAVLLIARSRFMADKRAFGLEVAPA